MDKFNYKFDPSKCLECGGKCCTGESGYIWINDEEMKRLSAYLGLNLDEFKEKCTYKVGIRFSLKEKVYNDGYACIFFDENNKNCGIYEYRPEQCKTFPFWDYFKKNYKELEEECIGVSCLL